MAKQLKPRMSPKPKIPRIKMSKKKIDPKLVQPYTHPEAHLVTRPDVGTQAQFKKKKPSITYRYDSSFAPELNWDGQNPGREIGEWLLACGEDASKLPDPHKFAQIREFKDSHGKTIATVGGLSDAVDQLKRLSGAFLNWAGKAERISFDVPTLPLFVHERLSTKAILETIKGHKRDKQLTMYELFGDPQHSIADQTLRAYEHLNGWTNRMILGDSLVVMNSLLHYEGLGDQVQMIYIDPPYGVKFGSNFQPFVRKRDVTNNDDDDMTREPEMVKAYRDTWEIGLHSYLTYMRDRLLVSRDLLSQSGSIFVQIGEENVHHVRELMDEIFGEDNFCSLISYRTSAPLSSSGLPSVMDYLLWYAKDRNVAKYHDLYVPRETGEKSRYSNVELVDGTRRSLTAEEKADPSILPKGSRAYSDMDLASSGYTESCIYDFEYNGKVYRTSSGKSWKTTKDGMEHLAKAGRISDSGKTIRYILYHDDFPVTKLSNSWQDTTGELDKYYVVQTHTKVIQRCILMTTDPGDLILDPTCGGGTTAFVSEQWGRRWITMDVSRVPLALARQRLLTATYDYLELKDSERGPAGGFVYKRYQNNKGEEIGGIVPHVTLKSIANNEPPEEEILVDRPEIINKITRVTGPFSVEATIPTPLDLEVPSEEIESETNGETYASFLDRMLEILRKSPVLHLDGGKTITLRNIRPPAKSLSLSAEATVDATTPGQKATLIDAVIEADERNGKSLPLSQRFVAIVFGPENGAVTERLVAEAAREAEGRHYTHLYVIGFAIQEKARQLIEKCEYVYAISATWIQATPDILMGDLLKNMRSSQIFSVCGLPEIKLKKLHSKSKSEPMMYQVELLGLDVFDPITMVPDHRRGDDVPAWFLDADYNDLCFHVSQAFFPRTSAWDNLKRALRTDYEDSVWQHLSGSTSAPFEMGENAQVAVKVIDDRGNELLVVKKISEAE